MVVIRLGVKTSLRAKPLSRRCDLSVNSFFCSVEATVYYSLCRHFLLLQLICIGPCHLSEKALHQFADLIWPDLNWFGRVDPKVWWHISLVCSRPRYCFFHKYETWVDQTSQVCWESTINVDINVIVMWLTYVILMLLLIIPFCRKPSSFRRQ